MAHNPEQAPSVSEQVIDIFSSVRKVQQELQSQRDAAEKAANARNYDMRTMIGFSALARLAQGKSFELLTPEELMAKKRAESAQWQKDILDMAAEQFGPFATANDERIKEMLDGKMVTATLVENPEVGGIGIKGSGGTLYDINAQRDPITAPFVGGSTEEGVLWLNHPEEQKNWKLHVLSAYGSGLEPQFSLHVQ